MIFQKKFVNTIFEILSEDEPHPKTELNYNNNFTLLIAIILSAQSTDIGVNKATSDLFKIADTPNKMLDLGEKELKNYIKSLGLFNSKAKNIIKLCEILRDTYNYEIPKTREQLETLPGVGRKTANVFLNCAFGENLIAVDTHVFRVSKRLGLTNANTPSKVEEDLMLIIPKKWLKYAHHWLILHGRYICKARKPECEKCKIGNLCPSNILLTKK